MNPPSQFSDDARLRVLVIAYYFPPMGLSGVQRISKFVKYLTRYGWEPEVLTVDPMGYYAYDETLLQEVLEEGVVIHRTQSKDPNRLFKKQQMVDLPSERTRKAWSGVSHFFLVPDSKIGWKKHAVAAGLALIKKKPFDIIFSTAPPFSAHLIGMELSEQTGIPLVADFREPWLDNSRHKYPTSFHRKRHLAMEEMIVKKAEGITTINRSIKEDLIKRHLNADAYNKIRIITHGFDPEDFQSSVEPDTGALRLTYSGMFYDAQVPDYFLKALHKVVTDQTELRKYFRAQFVGLPAPSLVNLVRALKMEDIVTISGYKNHREAVQLIQQASVLWMTLGHQRGVEKMSTSKLYEYFGTHRPILGLLPQGEEASTLKAYGASLVVPPDDIDAIARAILTLLEQWKAGSLPSPDPAFVERYNRATLAADLAKFFTTLLHTA